MAGLRPRRRWRPRHHRRGREGALPPVPGPRALRELRRPGVQGVAEGDEEEETEGVEAVVRISVGGCGVVCSPRMRGRSCACTHVWCVGLSRRRRPIPPPRSCDIGYIWRKRTPDTSQNRRMHTHASEYRCVRTSALIYIRAHARAGIPERLHTITISIAISCCCYFDYRRR